MLYSTPSETASSARVFEETTGYLTRLHGICAELSGAATTSAVADIICTQVVPLLGAQAGVVFMLSADKQEFVGLRIDGYGPDVQREWARFPADAPSPLGDAVRGQTLVVLETGDERRERYPHLAGAGAAVPGALVAVPAPRADGMAGAIGFVFSGSRTFPESERAFLLLLGEHCGAALARADAAAAQPAAAPPRTADNEALLLALRASEERLRLLLTATNDGVWDWQPATGEVFVSERWKEIMGLDMHSMPRAFDEWEVYVHPEDWPRVQQEFAAHLRGETPSYVSEHRIRRSDNSYRWIQTRGLALRDENNAVLRFLGTNADVTERKSSDDALAHVIRDLQAANERLEALATTDGLTGLKNERVFQQELRDEFRRACRYQTPLSLVLLDVDHFKSFNDAHGHPAGSRALRRLAQILSRGARETDSVCRYGGEEFVLLLPHTDGAEAMALAERLRVAVERAPWKRRALTISAGVCTLSRDMTQPSALLEHADAAMYAAKKAGRNRVVNGCADAPSQTLSLDFSG